MLLSHRDNQDVIASQPFFQFHIAGLQGHCCHLLITVTPAIPHWACLKETQQAELTVKLAFRTLRSTKSFSVMTLSQFHVAI